MARTISIPALAVVLSACGGLSNDDLLFISAVPTAQEVALEVDDAQMGNALVSADAVGDDAKFYFESKETADNINNVVEGLLKFVDELGRAHSPTERGDDFRIWGPVSNIDNEGFTLRLEIRRDRTPEGAPVFTVCLHIGSDAEFDASASITCQDPVAGGLHRAIGGTFEPRRIRDGVRSGSGTMSFNFEAVHRLNSDEDMRGLFVVMFDFSDGGEIKDIDVDWDAPVDPTEMFEFSAVRYEYDKNAQGFIDYSFRIKTDIVGGGLANPFSDLEETVSVVAAWKDDGPGRALLTIEGGDIPASLTATADECWDALHRRTYWRVVVPGDPSENELEGSEANCPQ